MGTINRPSRGRHKSSRNIISVRNKDTPRIVKPDRKASPAKVSIIPGDGQQVGIKKPKLDRFMDFYGQIHLLCNIMLYPWSC